jgi:hypothetical protein
MSTGISITNATYGTTSSSVNVTSSVSALVKDGVLSIPSVSPTALNVNDPAPGQAKVLSVKYIINNGSALTENVNDSGSLYINAPPQREATGFQITKAEYGYPGNYQDVTDAIQNHVTNGGIDITIGFAILGLPDPNPAKKKLFNADYTINGAKNSVNLSDGDKFTVSAPPLIAADNKSPKQHTFDIIGMLFTNLGYFVMAFLFFISFFTVLKFGDDFGGPVVLWGVLGLIPFSAFTIMPWFALVVRLFSETDFV